MEPVKNYYGNLCTEMYEILHKDAPLDELSFYLSYAEKGRNILEPLCGRRQILNSFFRKGIQYMWYGYVYRDACKIERKDIRCQSSSRDILEYDSEEKYELYFYILWFSILIYRYGDVQSNFVQDEVC